MVKSTQRVVRKNGLNYVVNEHNTLQRFTPWLGDRLAFLYDLFMAKSIFPKKFSADLNRHVEILRQALRDCHQRQVVELATGSGSAAEVLAPDNHYTGTDISPGLLRRAVKRFRKAGFDNAEFYVASAEDLPFEDGSFEVCLCHLSLNFFSDLSEVLREIQRVLRPQGQFLCSVPVPEKRVTQSPIRGTLHSEEELQRLLRDAGFSYERIPADNGALLYFRATLE